MTGRSCRPPPPASPAAAAAGPWLLLLLLLAAWPGSSRWGARAQPPGGGGGAGGSGCAAILRSAVYRSFYNRADAGPYAAFEAAVCSLPSTDLHELALPLGPEAQAAFQAAAAVLVPRWGGDGSGSEALNGPGLSPSNAYKVVRDYHTATCKALPVGGQVNVNTDNLKFYSSLGLTLVDAYTTCLLLANDGLQVRMESALGALPLELGLAYVPNPDNPGRMQLKPPQFVPAGNGGSCVVRDGAGQVLSWGADGGVNIPMQEGLRYAVSCFPAPSRSHDGASTNVFLPTFLETSLKPQGETNAYFNIMFHGLPFPPPPPSPTPPPSPPPSPAPPAPPQPPTPPPPSCDVYLPPACQQPWRDQASRLAQLAAGAEVEALASRVEGLEAANTQLAASNTALKQQVASLAADNARLATDNTGLKQATAELQAQAAGLKQEVGGLSGLVSNLAQQVQVLSTQLSELRAGQAAQREASDGVKTDVEGLKTAQSQQRAALDAVGGRVTAVESRAASLASDLGGLRSEVAQQGSSLAAGTTQLVNRVNEVSAALDGVRSEVAQHGTALASLSPLATRVSQVADMQAAQQAAVEGLRSEVAAVRAAQAQAGAGAGAGAGGAEALEAARAAQASVASLTARVTSVESSAASLLSDLNYLEGVVDDIDSWVSEAISDTRSDLESVEGHGFDIQTDLEDLQDALGSLVDAWDEGSGTLALPSRLCLGRMCLVQDDYGAGSARLSFMTADRRKTIMQVTDGRDRVLVFRDADGIAPYFYINDVKQTGWYG